MAQFTSMRNYSSVQEAQQQSYMFLQNARVQTEVSRSANTTMPAAAPFGGAMNDMASVGVFPEFGSAEAMAEVSEAKKCIGQVVLDWEFLHDLDLHLLKVKQPSVMSGSALSGGYVAEPNPEPTPGPSIDLNALVTTDARGQRLRSDVSLQSIVSYKTKIHNPSMASTPEAVLQVDRNAAVHSIKPVENLYLTETLDPGAYVIGVHNYNLRQLADNIIGPSTSHKYRTFDDFKKMDPGYQKMEKALDEQNAHACDPDGTPEKRAIMARVDQEMSAGSQMVQSMCSGGTENSGVHYGITVYSYPEQWTADAKHPQMASLDELQNLFQSGFFATADFIFDPDANTTGYNGANVVADVRSETGRLALANKKAAHVALFKIIKDSHSGKSRISEVIMLDGAPRPDLGENGLAPSAMGAFRSQRMTQRGGFTRGATTQCQEPCPEPHLEQMPMQMSQMPVQRVLPENNLQRTQVPQPGPELPLPTDRRATEADQHTHLQQMPMQMSQMPVQPALPENTLQRTQVPQPFPEPSRQQVPLPNPYQHYLVPERRQMPLLAQQHMPAQPQMQMRQEMPRARQ